MKHLQGKIAIVTGATHGLGRAMARKIADAGGKVILVARDKDRLEKLQKEIEGAGSRAWIYICDLRKPEMVRKVASDIIGQHDVDILFNGAGIWTEDELEKTRPELRQAALETNVLGHIEMTETLLPYFQKRNSGYIFNVISTSGASDSPSVDNSSWRAYGASKWAMRGYTNALLSLLKNTKIKVTGFYPGGFDSDIFETAGNSDAHGQPWMMEVEDVADAALFALTRPDDVSVETMVVTKKQ